MKLSSRTSVFHVESDWRTIGVLVAAIPISPLALDVFHYFLHSETEIREDYAVSEY